MPKRKHTIREEQAAQFAEILKPETPHCAKCGSLMEEKSRAQGVILWQCPSCKNAILGEANNGV